MELNYNFTLLMLIFMRMSGCILFNPIFGRKNVPAIFRVTFAFMLSLFTYSFVPQKAVEVTSVGVFFICAVKDFLVGFAIGSILQMAQSVIIMAGEQMDMQIGISMSKIYDPQSNISMPLSASILNAMFMLIFFLTNSHLTLMQIFVKLSTAVPYGAEMIPADVFKKLVSVFGLMLLYSVKLCLPVIAVEMISQIGIGIMMKAIPQIDIFTIEVQLKIIIGFVAIVVLVPPFSAFLERLIGVTFQSISGVFSMLT